MDRAGRRTVLAGGTCRQSERMEYGEKSVFVLAHGAEEAIVGKEITQTRGGGRVKAFRN